VKKTIVALLAFCFLLTCQPHNAYSQDVNNTGRPKNIILMIGDGMGIAHIKAASASVPYQLNIMRCTNTALINTSSANDIITDSGAAATAMATGSKTKNGAISVDSSGKNLKSILKYSEEHGLATGLIATSAITNATPAAFIANVKNRNELEEIAAQFLKTDIDLFIGGGLDNFNKRSDALNYTDSLKLHNYQIVTSLSELEASKSLKIAGLLYNGESPRISEGRGNMLPQAAAKAIEVLSKDPDGFFLMVEGSEIDGSAHENKFNDVVNELIDFDKAVGEAIDFAQKHPETLVIVVADHETGGLTLVEDDSDETKISARFSTSDHTASPVALFAYGKGADSFKGFIENTAIFDKMMELYGFHK